MVIIQMSGPSRKKDKTITSQATKSMRIGDSFQEGFRRKLERGSNSEESEAVFRQVGIGCKIYNIIRNS